MKSNIIAKFEGYEIEKLPEKKALIINRETNEQIVVPISLLVNMAYDAEYGQIDFCYESPELLEQRRKAEETKLESTRLKVEAMRALFQSSRPGLYVLQGGDEAHLLHYANKYAGQGKDSIVLTHTPDTLRSLVDPLHVYLLSVPGSGMKELLDLMRDVQNPVVFWAKPFPFAPDAIRQFALRHQVVVWIIPYPVDAIEAELHADVIVNVVGDPTITKDRFDELASSQGR